MADAEPQEVYEVLQVSPSAEPEVVAAAYRALAKKYHPDRSSAPDAMSRMAKLNVAYQFVRQKFLREGSPSEALEAPVKVGSSTATGKKTPPTNLQDVFDTINRRIAGARLDVVDEVVSAGISRDVAMNLVSQAVRESFHVEDSPNTHAKPRNKGHVDPDSSYEDVLKLATAWATSARDEVVDGLVHDGFQRVVATELADSAFDRIRRSRDNTHSRKNRLSHDQIDISGSLERGMDVVLAKAKTARQIVIDEITQDGVPVHTAEQLVQTAFERLSKPDRK